MDASRRRFEALFRTHYAAVRRYAYHRAITGGDADDLVAETFLVAWRRLDVVPEDDALPWLLAVAANVQRNQARSRRRYRHLVDRVRPAAAAPPPLEPSDDAPAIRSALAALTPDDREILLLVAWDGLTPHQASTVIGTSAGTARLRLHRARKRFAAHFHLTDSLRKRSSADGQFPGDTHRAEFARELRDRRASASEPAVDGVRGRSPRSGKELSHERAFRF